VLFFRAIFSRLFSQASLILTVRRNKLSDALLEMLLNVEIGSGFFRKETYASFSLKMSGRMKENWVHVLIILLNGCDKHCFCFIPL
jgi:hypothetical protein